MPAAKVESIADRLAKIIAAAQVGGRIELKPDVAKAWTERYPKISEDAGGKFGTVTARAEAHVLRLSLVYALLDAKQTISMEHFTAALAVWRYCYESARFVFGNAQSDPNVARILLAMRQGEKTQTELNKLFNGHLSASCLRDILSELQAVGRITQRTDVGGGRGTGKPRTYWALTAGFQDLKDEELEEIDE